VLGFYSSETYCLDSWLLAGPKVDYPKTEMKNAVELL